MKLIDADEENSKLLQFIAQHDTPIQYAIEHNDMEMLENIQPKIREWIPCSERLPEEHDSVFARFKGTDKWNNNMFEKISDEVNVTVVDKNSSGTTTHAHTIDGKWSCDLLKADKSYRIIAWQPLPEPYQPKGE